MKTLRKILLSTVLTVFAFVPANAGEMTLSGSMEISATTGLSGSNSGGRLGQENELTVKGSTELDDGTTVSYEQTLTGDNARNDLTQKKKMKMDHRFYAFKNLRRHLNIF